MSFVFVNAISRNCLNKKLTLKINRAFFSKHSFLQCLNVVKFCGSKCVKGVPIKCKEIYF